MEIATFILSQLLSYSIVTWFAFVLIALCAARYGGWWLVPLGHLAVAALIVFLDVRWIQSEMIKPGWNGLPDMDLTFFSGVLMRIILFNAVLLPVTSIGILLNRRKRGKSCIKNNSQLLMKSQPQLKRRNSDGECADGGTKKTDDNQ